MTAPRCGLRTSYAAQGSSDEPAPPVLPPSGPDPTPGDSAVLAAAVVASGRSGTRASGDGPVTATEGEHQERRHDASLRAVAAGPARCATTLSSVHLSASARAGEQTPTSDCAARRDPSRPRTVRDHRVTERGCRYGGASALRCFGPGLGSAGDRAAAEACSPRRIESLVPEALATPRPAVYHPAAREVAHEPLDHPLSHAAPAGAARTDRRRPRRERRHRARDRPTRARRGRRSHPHRPESRAPARAAIELGAQSTAAFDATDPAALERFFRDLPKPIDHVMVTGGRPYYAPLAEMDLAQVRRALDEHLYWRSRSPATPPARCDREARCCSWAAPAPAAPAIGLALASTVTAALPALDRQPRARDRPGPRQPHRRRLRRHAAVGLAPRR